MGAYYLLALVNGVLIISFSVAVLHITVHSELRVCLNYFSGLFSDFLKGVTLDEC